MRKIVNILVMGILCSGGLSGCIGIPSSSDGDANDGQEADTILQDRIADLEAALFSANSTIEWKETEIEILLSEVNSLRMNVDGTLESLYVSLQSDYQNLSSYSYNANQSLLSLEAQLSNEIALREELRERWAERPLKDMSNVRLSYANLQGADLSRTNLTGAQLYESNLIQANISSSNLSFADLSYSMLSGADLSHSDLTDSYLYSANMGGANLEYASLYGAYVVGLSLVNANLYGANLTDVEFYGVGWGNTICPDGTNSDDNGDTCENNI